jgi:hypothetical protein
MRKGTVSRIRTDGTYFPNNLRTSGLTSYLLISLTESSLKTPLGLQTHPIAIVRDRLQKFITTMVRFGLRMKETVWR